MRARSFHAAAWLSWVGATTVALLSVEDPFTTLAALAALGTVAATFARSGPEGRSFTLMLKLGLIFLLARLVLFGLTGRTGATTLFTLPEVGLPSWLGGFTLGGRITAEVLAQEGAEGLEIMALLAGFGVFLAAVPTYQVLRLLPRFLFEAGLVVGIALAFVPTMLRAAADVRDAQRLRGHRFRGIRSAVPLAAPVLAIALERSLTLAASMDVRGYGRGAAGDHVRARAAVLGGLIAITAGGSWLLFGGGAAAAALLGCGSALVAGALGVIGRDTGRSRMRPDRLDVYDVAVIVAAVLVAFAAIAARSLPDAAWYPYPAVRWPSVDLRLLALAVTPAAPVAVDAIRAARLRGASTAPTGRLPDPIGAAR